MCVVLLFAAAEEVWSVISDGCSGQLCWTFLGDWLNLSHIYLFLITKLLRVLLAIFFVEV